MSLLHVLDKGGATSLGGQNSVALSLVPHLEGGEGATTTLTLKKVL